MNRRRPPAAATKILRIFLWIGFTHHQQGNHRDAINSYGEALAKNPGYALAHVNKGRAYMDLKEYERAIECFNDAIRSEPDVGENYYNVGFAYMQQKKYQKAADFFRLALLQEQSAAEDVQQDGRSVPSSSARTIWLKSTSARPTRRTRSKPPVTDATAIRRRSDDESKKGKSSRLALFSLAVSGECASCQLRSLAVLLPTTATDRTTD